MKCLLDMDGILADFVHGICRVHDKPDPYEGPGYHGVFEIDKIFDLAPARFWEPCEHNFWRGLREMYDARVIVRICEEFFGKENICVLSVPSLNEECCAGKLAWLKQHFPQFYRSFLFGPRKEFCAHANTVLIDDRDKNVDDFEKHGGLAFLYPRPWNRKHDAPNADSGWMHLIVFLESIFGKLSSRHLEDYCLEQQEIWRVEF